MRAATTTAIRKHLRCLAAIAAPLFLAPASTTLADPGEEPEVQELRERLTEREDETRVEQPLVLDVVDRPLSLLGQYEVQIDYIDQVPVGGDTPRYHRSLLEQEIEGEAFYPLNGAVSLFLQLRLGMEEDLNSETPEGISDTFLERGESWIHFEEIADSPFSVEAGRLDYEDDRLWWWDEDLDSVRLIFEEDDYEIAVSAARELLPARSDLDFIEPEHNRVDRLILEASWDYADNHALQFFALRHDDRSRTENPGDIVSVEREDESDANLLWTGARANGAFDLDDRGLLGYWLDIGFVRGDEDLVSTETADASGSAEDEEDEEEALPPLSRHQARVTEVSALDVKGWAFDAGFTWLMPLLLEPRLTAAYAIGSGDSDPADGADKNYRQTGLHGNEPGFGGVQRFQGYGELLAPELSNISVLTFGIGCTILESSSIDLIFHDYALVERADGLRDSRLDAELTGESRDVGQGVDVVLALEEWETVELEFSASAFKAGDAFGRDDGDWIYGAFAAFRYAF